MSAAPRKEFDAIYEGGVFRPLLPAELPEGARVHLILEPNPVPSTPFDLLLHVYDGLSPSDISEVERIALDRSHFMSPSSEL